jgi:membrane associated rhomboid family serine protease
VFPYGDDPRPKRTRFPFFTIALLLINITIFVYQLTLGIDGAGAFIERWGFYPVEFWSGDRVFTIISSIFLHGGLLHIASNMIFLAIFGPNVEDQLGRRTFIIFYFAGGLIATIAYAIAFPDMDVPLVGASGAIAAVLGGYVLLFPRAMVRSLLFIGPFVTAGRVAAIILIGFWFLLQLMQSIVSVLELAPQENVAFLAHAAGFVFGVIAVGAIRESRDQTISHWESGDQRWFNRSFRNWVALVVLFGAGLATTQFLAHQGNEALASLLQAALLGVAGVVAILDGWWRIRGRPGLLGSTQRAERSVALIQIILGVSMFVGILVA